MSSTQPGRVQITLPPEIEEEFTTSGYDTTQGAVVEVKAVVTRLLPCDTHAEYADGDQHYDGAGRPMQNPNGYRHDCAACAAAHRPQEEID